MNKTELIDWLEREQVNWLALIAQVNPAKTEKPGVNGDWSVKDLIAHLTAWHQDHVFCLAGAIKGEEPLDPPWPLALESTDEINAWIYEHNRERILADILAENKQVFQTLISIVRDFPENIQIKDEYRAVKLGEKNFEVGYFFDHFHEDHEAQLKDWITKNSEDK